MNISTQRIDIFESVLRRAGNLLGILLIDQTTKKNIIWATDSYEKYGKGFCAKECIKPELVTGQYGMVIQPRAIKSSIEQRQRTRDKAEVFTPLIIVDRMNKEVDVHGGCGKINKKNWQEYVNELRLEITCGEAPFIVSRYDPTVYDGKYIELKNRVGFLDRKLQVVSKYCKNIKEWMIWTKKAFKASYGYEWQGDNVLLARENLLYTFIDYYKDKFKRLPTINMQEEIAEIISWNIFQMDGLKYVIPMSCHKGGGRKVQSSIFGEIPSERELLECEGCKLNKPDKHNGIYASIMDWNENKAVKFKDILN